ncbi:hypothetical protein Dimus_009896 [Dionaea muscipula]
MLLQTSPSPLITTVLLLPLLLLPSTIVLSLQATTVCPTYYCGSGSGAAIKFPFFVPAANESPRCGYPGFNLSCNQTQSNLPILTIPSSAAGSDDVQLAVQVIDYTEQRVWVTDPENCLPKRVLDHNLSTGSPFFSTQNETYTFYNCSGFNSSSSDWYSPYNFFPITCASGDDYGVGVSAANSSSVRLPQPPKPLLTLFKCRELKAVTGPKWFWLISEDPSGFGFGFGQQYLQLAWSSPDCGNCSGSCGFKTSSGLEVTCLTSSTSSSGLFRSAKYAVILVVGVTAGLLVIACLVLLLVGKLRVYNYRRRHSHSHNRTTTEFSLSIIPQYLPAAAFIGAGLDGATIESYPKTVLGESLRLPKPSDGTCAICLSEYVPRETLRTIPDCNHYFHAKCIDEWLRMKGVCPVCRNSPERSRPLDPTPS